MVEQIQTDYQHPRHIWRVVTIWAATLGLTLVIAAFVPRILDAQRHQFQRHRIPDSTSVLLLRLASWDGVWYEQIVRLGYKSGDTHCPTIAFFPLFPLLARLVTLLLPLTAVESLVALSNICLLAASVLVSKHAAFMTPARLAPRIDPALVLFLSPLGVFFRSAYSESLFLLEQALFLLALSRRWHPAIVAAIAGAASATRAPGCALSLVALVYLWRTRNTQRLSMMVIAPLLAVSGIGLFVLYQWFSFGTPLAFVTAQSCWVSRPHIGACQHCIRLLTLEPLWSVFTPSSEAYWHRREIIHTASYSMQFWNPLSFVLACGLVGYGKLQGVLTADQMLLSVALLLIPYCVQGPVCSFYSFGRYAASVLPIYYVVAHIIGRCNVSIQLVALVVAASLYMLITLGFMTWYRIF